MITLTPYELNICIKALKIAEPTEKNEAHFGSVLINLLQKVEPVIK